MLLLKWAINGEIKGTDYKYSFTAKVPAIVEAGDYIFGLSIIDTTNNKPGVQLAIKDLQKLKGGWFEIETIHVFK